MRNWWFQAQILSRVLPSITVNLAPASSHMASPSCSVLLASNNQGKLREFRGMLAPRGFQVVSPGDRGIELVVPETAKTFGENARLKAEAFCRASEMLTLADDSGLMVDALHGEPGIHSARFAGEGASDADRVRLLLWKTRDVPPELRTARFVAALAVARPGCDTQTFEETVEGLIALEPRGEHGFGFDPVFIHPASGFTFAEMEPAQKFQVSHRGRALIRAAAFLEQVRTDCILGQNRLGEGSE